MVKRYLRTAKVASNSEEFIFRTLLPGSTGLWQENKQMSYTLVRELILQQFSKVGLNSSTHGLHSLRSGGATTAANAGVHDRLFKRHGRWRSENAKDSYIKDDLKSLLSVSKNLGL